MIKTAVFDKEMAFPPGRLSEFLKAGACPLIIPLLWLIGFAGYLLVRPGDVFLNRDINGDQDPMHDRFGIAIPSV